MIETERLLLRPWRPEDLPLFARMNADPVVMEFFPRLLTPEESRTSVASFADHLATHRCCFWAAEVKESGAFIGFIGLQKISFMAGYDVGWRLAPSAWGKGYATEGGKGSLRYGFQTLGLSEILSFTAPGNLRSRAVMDRIGMKQDLQGEFDHPRVPEGPLRRHVLYRVTASEWQAGAASP